MEVCASMPRTVARYGSILSRPSHSTDNSQLLGHFEHLHIGQLSHASFADSRTLITCGTDCTISLWTVTAGSRSVDLQPIGSLFGHRTPVTTLAVSRSFSALLSASSDGQIMLWDLNRRCFVRALPADGTVDVSIPQYPVYGIHAKHLISSVPESTTLLGTSLSVEADASPCIRLTEQCLWTNRSAIQPMTTFYPVFSTKASKMNG
jgi:WD40 repeat protein